MPVCFLYTGVVTGETRVKTENPRRWLLQLCQAEILMAWTKVEAGEVERHGIRKGLMAFGGALKKEKSDFYFGWKNRSKSMEKE